MDDAAVLGQAFLGLQQEVAVLCQQLGQQQQQQQRQQQQHEQQQAEADPHASSPLAPLHRADPPRGRALASWYKRARSGHALTQPLLDSFINNRAGGRLQNHGFGQQYPAPDHPLFNSLSEIDVFACVGFEGASGTGWTHAVVEKRLRDYQSELNLGARVALQQLHYAQELLRRVNPDGFRRCYGDAAGDALGPDDLASFVYPPKPMFDANGQPVLDGAGQQLIKTYPHPPCLVATLWAMHDAARDQLAHNRHHFGLLKAARRDNVAAGARFPAAVAEFVRLVPSNGDQFLFGPDVERTFDAARTVQSTDAIIKLANRAGNASGGDVSGRGGAASSRGAPAAQGRGRGRGGFRSHQQYQQQYQQPQQQQPQQQPQSNPKLN
ncbi:hypothetical protein H9P43_002986 [Blastocladiella emersonii ATCC 22665]|nr:hypothetical protein H9P43_002986 [Blastocladiella emersonii ATCC 22665]